MPKIAFDTNDAESAKRRKELGKYLRALRVGKEWTQVEAAKQLGYEWFTFITQVEGGHARVPTAAWERWADTYGVTVRDFAMKLLRHYDPHLYKIMKG